MNTLTGWLIRFCRSSIRHGLDDMLSRAVVIGGERGWALNASGADSSMACSL